jgi:hypothetical protein
MATAFCMAVSFADLVGVFDFGFDAGFDFGELTLRGGRGGFLFVTIVFNRVFIFLADVFPVK